MENVAFIGMLVIAIPSLYALITPIVKLNGSITELTVTIKSMRDDMAKQNERISKHGGELDKVREHATKQDIRLENHETRLSNLENDK